MVLAKFVAAFALALLLAAEPFQFEFAGQTDSSGRAHLTVIANEAMPTIEVVIEGDGQTIRKTISGMAAGTRKTIQWQQRAATAEYDLDIRGGNMQTDFRFKVTKGVGSAKATGRLQVLSDREEIVKGKKIRYRTSSALSSYEYKVYDTQGDVIAGDLVTGVVPAGGTFEVSWDSPDEVFMVWAKGENDFGGFTEYKLVPWSVEIPHTEINFDSGKWNIKGDEEWKVKEALDVALHELVGLEKVNKAVNANLTPRLYIVGYTDTVGRASSNQKLSEGRAQAIAKYFYDHGFWSEIYYAGMGERGLRVPTEDNVDEVKNRRALYLLAIQQPPPGGQIPGNWKKLSEARTRPAGFQLPPLPERWKDHKAGQGGGKSSESAAGGEEAGTGSSEGAAPEDGEGTYEASNASADTPSDAGEPPPVEGAPGATAKGCAVAAPGSGPSWGWLALLIAWGRRRTALASEVGAQRHRNRPEVG